MITWKIYIVTSLAAACIAPGQCVPFNTSDDELPITTTEDNYLNLIETTDLPATTLPKPQYEVKTNDLIVQNQEKAAQMHLLMVRYQTQLDLNLLESTLPLLQDVRKNLTALLDHPMETADDFERESELLLSEMIRLEGQFTHNRVIQQKYSQVQKDTRKQLEIVHKALGEILNSQVQLLNPEITTKPSGVVRLIERTLEEVEIFFSQARSGGVLPQAMYEFTRSTAPAESRARAYELLVNLLKETNPDPDTFVAVASDISKHQELHLAQASLPSRIQAIFYRGGIAIEMRRHTRLLGYTGSSVNTNREGRSNRPWQFDPVEGEEGQFFMITHTVYHISVGVANTPSSSRLSAADTNSVKTNINYHWKLVPILSSGSYYIMFHNRGTGLALDANDNSEAYPFAVNSETTQHWELHISN